MPLSPALGLSVVSLLLSVHDWMAARSGATVAASMWSGGLMLTAHAQNYSEPHPEYTRCTPCPLTPFNWVKLRIICIGDNHTVASSTLLVY